MKKRFVFIILFWFNIGHFFTQENLSTGLFSFGLEANTFLNKSPSIYQGSNLLLTAGINLSQTRQIGISIGGFHFRVKESKAAINYMKYTYFPVYFFYQAKFGKRNNFIGIKVGLPFLSYFDSELTYHSSFLRNEMWPNYSNLTQLDNVYPRSKPFLIFSPYYKFKIVSKLNGLLGLSTYLSNGFYLYLNLGFSYQIR